MSEMKKTVFVAGMPRSGSTLLLNILGQNPRFHVTGTSGVIEILFNIRNQFSNIQAFKALGEDAMDKKCIQTMKGALNGFYSDVTQSVVFDKSRGWEAYLEILNLILGEKPKIICPVRDIREVLASFEKLYRFTMTTRQLPDERAFFYKYQTIEGRCNQLLSIDGGIVGVPVTRIRDAVARGWRSSICFVEYNRLTSKPREMMEEIYDFIGEEYHKHDFQNVQQMTKEDDLVYLYKGLHDIRPKIEPQEPQWHSILPKSYTDLIANEATFWKAL
jgi:sulfotransferase